MALCSLCSKIELTLEEERKDKKICFFCRLEAAEQIEKSTGMKVKKPEPGEYGRTSLEIQEYLVRKKNYQQQTPTIQNVVNGDVPQFIDLGAENGQVRPGAAPIMGDDHIAHLLSKHKLDEPSHEFYMAINEDFNIRIKVPGPLSDKMHKLIQRETKQLFTNIVYLKTQGSIFEKYFRDPDEEQQQGLTGLFNPGKGGS